MAARRPLVLIDGLPAQLPAGDAVVVDILHVRDEKAANTAGDTFTAGSYQMVTLNAVKINTITGASVSSSQVVLPAGTYEVNAMTGVNQGLQRSRIYDVTNSAVLLQGLNNPLATGSAPAGPYAFMQGYITLAGTTTLEYQHRTTVTSAAAAANFGDTEVYADLIIKKLA